MFNTSCRFKLQYTEVSLLLLLIIVFQTSFAQVLEKQENTFSLSGQLRPRFEFRSGSYRPLQVNENPAALTNDRVRLQFDYSYKNILQVRISPQAVGVWGQSSMVQGAESSGSQFSLYEAYANLYLSKSWDLKVGRQAISLDDERFFGALDWAPGARAFDGLSFQLKKTKAEFKSFFVYNQNYKPFYNNNLSNPAGNLYATMDAYPFKWMQTLWAKIPLGDHGKLSGIFTNLGFQNAISAADPAPTYWQQTVGANYVNFAPVVSGSASAYYQVGKDNKGVSTKGYLLAAHVIYKTSEKLSVKLGSDYLSGNDLIPSSTDNKAFVPYFGTNHKFYGSMDYFYSGNGHKNVGLNDDYLQFIWKQNKKFMANLSVHQFFAAGKMQNASQTFSKNLGQELDFGFTLQFNKFSELAGGYSLYFTNASINQLKNTIGANSLQQWGWLSLNIKPKFFEYKY